MDAAGFRTSANLSRAVWMKVYDNPDILKPSALVYVQPNRLGQGSAADILDAFDQGPPHHDAPLRFRRHAIAKSADA